MFLWFEWQIYQLLTACGQHGGDSSLLCLVSQSVEDPEPPTILKHRLMLNDVLSRPYIVPDRVAWWKGITNDSVDGEFHELTQGSHRWPKFRLLVTGPLDFAAGRTSAKR